MNVHQKSDKDDSDIDGSRINSGVFEHEEILSGNWGSRLRSLSSMVVLIKLKNFSTGLLQLKK